MASLFMHGSVSSGSGGSDESFFFTRNDRADYFTHFDSVEARVS